MRNIKKIYNNIEKSLTDYKEKKVHIQDYIWIKNKKKQRIKVIPIKKVNKKIKKIKFIL